MSFKEYYYEQNQNESFQDDLHDFLKTSHEKFSDKIIFMWTQGNL